MAAAKKPRRCVDCRDAGRPLTRPAPHPGPRCATDWRLKKSDRRETAREQRLIDTYDIDLDEYGKIKAYQGGKCAICRIATGARRALAVDHDHATGYIRGCLCKPCNVMLGRARDSTEFFERAIEYLKNPPAFAVIGKRIAPIEREKLSARAELDT
ncbi:endonuclease VII [Mycobacterium phage Switzer]|uniref:Endonuclease VII n=1 Tax=Mycobacterium phage Switzer TaxID=1034118 RepID=G1D6G0_9CAUD|nr:endonuclease VII [Mycobacterium phage Switzer]AEK10359.1 endonuclease VII [Mycobacterium phage Switzer]